MIFAKALGAILLFTWINFAESRTLKNDFSSGKKSLVLKSKKRKFIGK